MSEFTAGVYTMDDGTYHRDPLRGHGTMSLSVSGSKWLLPPHPPARFKHFLDHPEDRPSSDAMIEGAAFHSMLLGGRPVEDIGTDRLVGDHKAEVVEKQLAGVLCVKTPVFERLTAMVDAVRSHEIASMVLKNGKPEQALFTQDKGTGVWLRAKADWLGDPNDDIVIVGEVKTTSGSAHPLEFGKTTATFGYHRQAAWTIDLVKALKLASKARFFHVVVEKDPPHLVNVMEIHNDHIIRARKLNKLAIATFAYCLEHNQWPGYGNKVHSLQLPTWSVNQDETILEES